MRLHHHTAFSIVVAGILYMIFKSWGMALSCFISGIFIDIDHFIDVIREHGWHIKISNFFRICNESQFNRILLILHGWEWLVLWGIAAWLTNWNLWVTGGLIGISTHLILDAVYNTTNLLSYSLIWRWKQDFYFDTVFSNLKNLKYKYRKEYSDSI